MENIIYISNRHYVWYNLNQGTLITKDFKGGVAHVRECTSNFIVYISFLLSIVILHHYYCPSLYSTITIVHHYTPPLLF